MSARDVIAAECVWYFAAPDEIDRTAEALGHADHILAALAAAGMKVVGREPTEEMIRAGEYDRRLVTSGVDTVWEEMWKAAEPLPRGPMKEEGHE